ncbi:MAG: hypothetical protein C0597_02500 [Marinilabiliales bacterium]|nr:MAG: hypothetical protein C0597_02500 [Marinilabiliales bacterium]
MKKFKLIIKKTAIVLFSGMLMVSLVNCSGGKKGAPNEKSTVDSGLDKEAFEENVREIVYPLPTAFEVTEMINKVEASYIIGITNRTENIDKYFTDKDQAINLGVYSADLSYASTYNMKQEIMSYMETLENLVVELGITGAFSIDFIDEVEANIDNKDVLVELITGSFYDTYEYLVKNNKEDLSLLVLAGTWVEAMYISCNISETIYHNPELVKVIMHQKTSLVKLIEMFEEHKEHESIAEVLNALMPIKEVYDSVDETGITEQQLNNIIEQTNALRKKIIL